MKPFGFTPRQEEEGFAGSGPASGFRSRKPDLSPPPGPPPCSASSRKIADTRGSGDRSARLEDVGMRVARTPLTPRSITSAALPVPSSAWNRWVGSSRVASTSSSDVSRSGSRIPVVGTRQSIPRAASNSRVHKAAPLERSSQEWIEENSNPHWIPGGKAVRRWLDRLARQGTNPWGSSSCHQKESKFQRRSRDSGNSVVNSVCRDSADGL